MNERVKYDQAFGDVETGARQSHVASLLKHDLRSLNDGYDNVSNNL